MKKAKQNKWNDPFYAVTRISNAGKFRNNAYWKYATMKIGKKLNPFPKVKA